MLLVRHAANIMPAIIHMTKTIHIGSQWRSRRGDWADLWPKTWKLLLRCQRLYSPEPRAVQLSSRGRDTQMLDTTGAGNGRHVQTPGAQVGIYPLLGDG
jgi:hypothetical protein